MPSPDYIQHYHAVRVRATGAGILRMKLESLDAVYSQTLATVTLATASERPITVLANFMQARACLRVSQNAIDEGFEIRQLVIYVAPVYTSYPQ